MNCQIPGLQNGLDDNESLSACLDEISDEDTPQRVVRIKEQVVEVTFIMDSFPSYLLVISKIPKRKLAKTENEVLDGTTDTENFEVMFRILSLQESK